MAVKDPTEDEREDTGLCRWIGSSYSRAVDFIWGRTATDHTNVTPSRSLEYSIYVTVRYLYLWLVNISHSAEAWTIRWKMAKIIPK